MLRLAVMFRFEMLRLNECPPDANYVRNLSRSDLNVCQNQTLRISVTELSDLSTDLALTLRISVTIPTHVTFG